MKLFKNRGFTLVEVLVVIAISGIVASAILGFFISQQRAHTAQEQVSFMNQNARAGLGIMSRELRMAGYDPMKKGFTTFSDPTLSQITFRSDIDGDGDLIETVGGVDVPDPDEVITYSFDNPSSELRRNGAVLAEGIESVAFAFAYDGNDDGAWEPGYSVVQDDAGTLKWFLVNNDGSLGAAGPIFDASEIRAVKIWLLARAGNDDPNFTNTASYVIGTQTIAPTTANLRRRHIKLETVVSSRNMGL